MWQLVRNIVVSMFTIWTLSKYGPPAVDNYFLPTIEYVSDAFLAIAPQPAPTTASPYMHGPMAAGPTFTIPETVFVRQTGYGARSMPERAPITVMKYGQRSSTDSSADHDGPVHGFFTSFKRYSRVIQEKIQAILFHLRRVLDNFFFQLQLGAAIIITWKLLEFRNQMTIRNITASHEVEIAGVRKELSAGALAKGSEIASVTAQNDTQKLQLDAQRLLLEKARTEIEAKTMAEEKSKNELARLKTRLTDKDGTIAEREDSLTKVTKRAEAAEASCKALENKAKKAQSDFDSIIQKKENEIGRHKRTLEQATKEADTARHELKGTKSQASKDRKKITELEEQATESNKSIAELEARVKDRDATIVRKDGVLTNLREERQKVTRDIKTAEAQRDKASRDGRDAANKATKANNLCKAAEAKASEQEALAAEAIERKKAAEGKASEQEAVATKAFEQLILAEAKISEQEALAAARAELPAEELEDRVEALKGEVADLLEENDRLRAALDDTQKQKPERQEEGDEAAVTQVPTKAQKQSRTLSYNRNKLRSNKRLDGSIRTSTHPRNQPPQPQAADDEPRFCRFFQRGNCKFGAKCLDIHELPASSYNRPEPSEEPFPPASKSASVHQADDHQTHPSRAPTSVRPICGYYQRGHCRFGAKCRDSHNLPLG